MSQLWERYDRARPLEKGAFLLSCRDSLEKFMEFVFGWRVREHQRPWVRALQALVIPPPCVDTKHPLCECEEAHVCNACFECRVHDELRILILAFVGSGKSDTLLEFACWTIGRDPEEAQYGLFSYNDNVATERSILVRDIIWSPEVRTLSASEPAQDLSMAERYALVFPGVTAAKERGQDKPWGQERFYLYRRQDRKDPTFVASGIEGSVNARRLLGIILDDPHDIKNTHTPDTLESVWRNWHLVINKRATGRTWKVCICPRWEDGDLPGRFMDEGWPTLMTPLLDENDNVTWPYEPQINRGFELAGALEERAGHYPSFMKHRQCVVVPELGKEQLMAPREMPWRDFPGRYDEVVQSWDTAEKPGRDRSDTVCTTWGRVGNEYYVLDVWVGQPTMSDLPNKVLGQLWEFDENRQQKVSIVLIEEASSGTGLLQLLKRSHPQPWRFRGVKVGGRTKTRDDRVQEFANAFRESVIIPSDAPWKGKYVQQLLSYPHGKNDMVMASVQALKYLSRGSMAGAPLQMAIATYSGWDY